MWSAYSIFCIPCHEFRVCTWLLSYQIWYCLAVRKSPAIRANFHTARPRAPAQTTTILSYGGAGYLGEISEVPRQGQVQLLRVVVGEDPGKDRVLVQVVVRPPWRHAADSNMWAIKGWKESWAEYTWGFGYFRGSACNIPTRPQSQSPQSDTLPVSHGACQVKHTLMASAFCYEGMWSVIPVSVSVKSTLSIGCWGVTWGLSTLLLSLQRMYISLSCEGWM